VGAVSPVVGRAFNLDGINDRVDVPDAPGLRPQRFTLAAWVQADVSSQLACIICVADVDADKLGQAQACAESEGDDRVVADVRGGRAENQPMLVGCQRGRGEVRHGGLLAAQARSVGEEVKGSIAAMADNSPARSVA